VMQSYVLAGAFVLLVLLYVPRTPAEVRLVAAK